MALFTDPAMISSLSFVLFHLLRGFLCFMDGFSLFSNERSAGILHDCHDVTDGMNI